MNKDFGYICFCNDKFFYYLGGIDTDGNTLKTTEIIYPNGSKTEGPIELPEVVEVHCMVEYAGIIISMGGTYVTHYRTFLSQMPSFDTL